MKPRTAQAAPSSPHAPTAPAEERPSHEHGAPIEPPLPWPRHGVLVIDKPSGPTSHDVVARLRRALGVKRIGHAGTLDPMASGVLVVLVGEGTKLAPYLTAQDKRYTARVALGVGTDTLDAEGEITATQPLPAWLDEELAALAAAGEPLDAGAVARTAPRIAAALDAERARTAQTPPAYSAIKVEGRRSYTLARAGQAVDLAARDVEVRSLTLTAVRRGAFPAAPAGSGPSPAPPAGSGPSPAPPAGSGPFPAPAAGSGPFPAPPAGSAPSPAPPAGSRPVLELDLDVSKGYYVRSLARDLGTHLGVPAHLAALRRTASGLFTADQAVPLDAGAAAFRSALRPLAEAASDSLPVARLTEEGARRARLGQSLAASDFSQIPAPAGVSVWLDPDGHVVALGTIEHRNERVTESQPALSTTRFSVLRGFSGAVDLVASPER